MLKLLDKLLAKTAFPQFNNLQFERNKLDIIRIILGLVVFTRNFQIVDTLYLLQSPKDQVLFGLIHLVVIACFTVGLFTPIFTWVLLIISISMDLMYGTFTLGTSILCITLLTMALVNPGTNYSLDAILFKRSKIFKKILKPLYSASGATRLADLRRAYFFGFLLYAIISLGAIFLHIQDEYWVNGLTTKSLLLNSYLCKYYPWFRSIEAIAPWVLSSLSIAAGILQSIFQFLMIPLIFWKWGRKFVFWWGLNFFLISLFFINLSYLPHIEILLWLLIFVPVSATYPTKVKNNFATRFYRSRLLKPQGSLKQFGGIPSISKVVFSVYFVGFLIYLGFKFPYVNELIPRSEAVDYQARVIVRGLGFDLPKVFNRTDLRMGDNWMEIYVCENEKEILCPITGQEGQRLNYASMDWMLFNNHNSDKLYYHSTMVFRRGILLNNTKDIFSENSKGWRVIKRRVRYDYLYRNRTGTARYRIAIMHAPMSEVTHSQVNPSNFTPTKIYELFAEYDGVNLSIFAQE